MTGTQQLDTEGCLKGGWGLTGQTGDKLSIKINTKLTERNQLNKIGDHESKLIFINLWVVEYLHITTVTSPQKYLLITKENKVTLQGRSFST